MARCEGDRLSSAIEAASAGLRPHDLDMKVMKFPDQLGTATPVSSYSARSNHIRFTTSLSGTGGGLVGAKVAT